MPARKKSMPKLRWDAGREWYQQPALLVKPVLLQKFRTARSFSAAELIREFLTKTECGTRGLFKAFFQRVVRAMGTAREQGFLQRGIGCKSKIQLRIHAATGVSDLTAL
jgi:hypothetical protein